MFHTSEGSRLQIGDASVYYETAGNPEGETLVLLHGGLGTVAEFNFNGAAQLLGETYRLIGIDFRGHGKSTLGSAPANYAQLTADVEAVLDAEGIESFRLLGYSDGGTVAYRLAASLGDRVQALAAIAAPWRAFPGDPLPEVARRITPELWRRMLPRGAAYYESVNPEADFGRLIGAVTERWMDLTSAGYPGESVSRITAPTLIVRGDNDWRFPLAEAVELKARIPECGLLNVPFSGHLAPHEVPELVFPAVKAFLDHPERLRDDALSLGQLAV